MGTMENQETLMSHKPHTMFLPYPLQGHMNPMIQFSKHLVSKGINVTIVTTANLEISSHAKTDYIHFERISVDNPSSQRNNADDAIEESIALYKKGVMRSLPEVIEKQKSNGCPVKILVYDALMPWVLDICHKVGVKGVAFCTYSSAVFAIFHHVYDGTFDIDSLEELSNVALPALPVMEIEDLPSYIYERSMYQILLLLHKNQFFNMEKAECVLFNTFDKLECEVVNWLSGKWKIMTIGPSIPSMFLDKRLADDRDYGLSLFKPNEEACIEWLDTKETDSVVYVSFGSLADLMQANMDEISWGLLNSKHNFLWVVRDTEKSKLPKNFTEESSDRGLVVNWCPQLEVLAHKAVGSFMTHCGWNSTLEALCLGVPMMVMPQWTDQTTNAKYIVDVWKTGVRVKPHDKESITRDDIANCVIDVMEGTKREELKANAIKWKEMALEAMSEGGSSDKNIDNFISEIVSPATSI